jgi:arylsulfatase A-like enzyme
MQSGRPNILFILTDQQAWANHPRVAGMPAWTAFGREGVTFQRAYSVCPLCTPARCSMMTGMYPSSHGLLRNCDASEQREFRQGQQLYSHYLASAGYRNALIGKWHCGAMKLPADYGIEGWSLPAYGKFYMSEAYQQYADERGLGPARARIEYNLDHPEWRGETHVLHSESPWHYMNGAGVLQGPPEAHEANFVTHLAAQQLKELASGSQPWSLVTCYWGPHQPYYPTEPFASAFDPASIPEHPSFRDDLKGRPLRYVLHRETNHVGAKAWAGNWAIWQRILALAYGQQLQTDAAIGSLLKTLEETGQADNTIVIWSCDHGDAVASHGGLWDKASTMTEEVMRVPLAIRWPARLPRDVTRQQLVSNLDVTATMLAAANVPVPATMHSRSLLPLCCDESADWPDHVFAEHHGHGEIMVERMIVRGRYKYVAALFDGHELYDLEADPIEVRNLIHDEKYADIRDDLRRRLLVYLQTHQQIRDARQLIAALTHGDS